MALMRREVLVRCVRAGVSGVGFKILLDLFATAPEPLCFKELPYGFRTRHSGQSKLDTNVAWEFFVMLLDRFLGRVVPIRFIAFSIVGFVGLAVHLAVLALLFKLEGADFDFAQGVATLVAMSGNFALNNLLTYRDMGLRGWALVRGWASFVLACSVGALAYVGISAWMFEHRSNWSTGPLCVPALSFASINAGTSRKPQSGNPCAGLSPGGWKNRDATQWPSPYKPTDLFKDRFGQLGPYSATDTLLSVLSNGGGDDVALGRHVVATLLNAQAGLIPPTIFTAAGVVAFWDKYIQDGSKFYPNASAMTPVWGPAEVMAWLKAMML